MPRRQETLDDLLWEAWIDKVSDIAVIIYEKIVPNHHEISAYEIQKILREKYGIKATLRDIDEAIEIIVADSDFNPLRTLEYYIRRGHKVLVNNLYIPPKTRKMVENLLTP